LNYLLNAESRSAKIQGKWRLDNVLDVNFENFAHKKSPLGGLQLYFRRN
jgi:hypothetical protein